MDYYRYKAEDFASDDYFKEWVLTPDPESDRFWEEFLKEYPEKYYDLHEGRRLVEGLEALFIPAPDPTGASDRIWERLEHSVKGRAFLPGIFHNFYSRISAACLLVLAGFLTYHFYTGRPPVERRPANPESPGRIYENPGAGGRIVKLPDGSAVQLYGASSLEYQENATAGIREVKLRGSAFFEVVKRPGMPFVVKAGGMKTTVLGTSFRIRAYEVDRNVTIEVKSGKVRVSKENGEAPGDVAMVLTPNQKAVFSKVSQSFYKDIVEKPVVLPAGAGGSRTIYIFDDAPIAKVFEAIESQYGIRIVYDKELMKDCRLKINLEHESLFRKLDVISLALGIAYEKTEGKIIFEKKGCQ